MATFDEKGDFLQFLAGEVPYLRDALAERSDAGEAIAASFAVEVPDAVRAPDGSRGLIVRRFRWVIQSDDLAALKAIGDGLKAAAGAGFFTNLAAAAFAPVAGAAAGVLFALLTLARQAWKKGASLSAEEMAVLAVLASARRPLSAPRVTEALAQQHPGAGWDITRVTKALTALEKVLLADGSVKSFVARTADEQWSAVDAGLIL